ncbi:hypothetical protein ZEAMMB73_Zm00001d002994 [Zea mays]|uniref:Uncharacterized protein n=1 Tax=Zea mays TaxID=4577 RepID=A0A1D6E5W6_MAIZE|nr:hypothetical protein ZEAMMB73_Zm00001d002994 [Zea mays]
MAPIVGGRVGEVARVSPVVVVSFGPTVGRYCFHPPTLTSLLHLIPSPPPARLPAVHRSPPSAAIQPPVQGSSSRSQPCPVPSRREARRLGSWSEDKETRERMQQLQPKQMHWVRTDSSDFGGDRPAPRSGHTAVIYRHMHPPPRLLLRCLPLTPRLLHATSSMQHSSPPMWPPSHQRHDASCEEDDLYGYGGIVNEWGTIGLLLLEAAAERIVGDGALETWGVGDKATRVKLCMLARGRSHAPRRAARNVFEERQLHSHLHRVVVAALSIQPFRV